MMSPFSAVSFLYRFLAPRKAFLYGATLALVLAGAFSFVGLRISDDIRTMLPEEPSKVREEFELLQQAPFSRKILITLERRPETSLGEMIAAADRACLGHGPPPFRSRGLRASGRGDQ